MASGPTNVSFALALVEGNSKTDLGPELIVVPCTRNIVEPDVPLAHACDGRDVVLLTRYTHPSRDRQADDRGIVRFGGDMRRTRGGRVDEEWSEGALQRRKGNA